VSKKIISVGVGQLKVARSPSVLVTYNLGSCVGVAIHDIYNKIGGLAHVTLPRYIHSDKKDFAENHSFKFADTAIPLMIKKMEDMGANRSFMVAKIAGGADMFGLPDTAFELDIGKQNVEMIKELLQEYGINIVAEEVLGCIPRTMELDLNTGKVTLKTAQMEIRYL